MDIKELSSIWNSTEASAQNPISINRKLLKAVTVHEVKSLLTGLKWSWIFELVVDVFFFFFLTNFISSHYLAVEFLIPALILFAVNLASLFKGFYKIKLYAELSTDSPVWVTQLKLARLKYIEVLEVNSLFVIIPLFSAPILIVLAEGFFGFNMYQLGNWVLNYTLGSVVVGIVVTLVIKRFPSKNLEQAIDLFKDIKDIDNQKE